MPKTPPGLLLRASERSAARSSRQTTPAPVNTAGRSPPAGGLGRRYRDPRFDYLVPCTGCNGRGRNPHHSTCPAAAGQAASSWIEPPFPGRERGGSHDSGAPPASRHPCADRPPPPYLRRHAQPYWSAAWRWRYEIALVAGLSAVLPPQSAHSALCRRSYDGSS